MKDAVAHYVQELAGPRSGDAWFGLVDLGPSALESVCAAFAAAKDARLRRDLLTVIVEYRVPGTAPFFGSLLCNDDTEIWRTALDGLVTLGTEEAARILENARTTADEERRAWIDEALEQVREGPFPDSAWQSKTEPQDRSS